MTDDAAPLTLIGSPGCGSAIVEMALALLGLPHVLEDLPYREPGPGRDRLLCDDDREPLLRLLPDLRDPDGEWRLPSRSWTRTTPMRPSRN